MVLTAAQVTTLTPPAAITGFSTETTLAALNAKVTAVNTGAVVLAAGAAAIGSVTVTGSVAVTGPLTDAQLRAAVVPVSLTSTTITGTVAATQSGTWNIGSITTLPALPAGTNNIGDVDVLTLPVAFDTGLTTATTQRVVAAADLEMATTPGLTSLRDGLVAQRYTVLADSIADGINATWTSTVANGGTTTSTGGEGLIQTSANAAGAALLVSTTVNYFPGQVSWFNSAVRFGDTGSAGNIRRIGVFTLSGTAPQEGYFFELNGTTLNAVVVKAGAMTAVASTSWSRFAVAPFTLDTNYHSFELRWTANSILFYVDNVLRHSVSGTTTPLTTTLNFPMAIQSINTSGATNRLIAVRNCGIGRFGTQDITPVTINNEPSATFRGRAATFRTPGRAGTAGQKIFALHNATGSTKIVRINRLFVDKVETVVKAVTVLPPLIRANRFTAVPTNGTALAKTGKDTAQTSNASVTAWGDASADGTGSGTTLTITPGACIAQEFAPRLITAAGYEMADRIALLDGEDIMLRPLEGIVVFLDYVLATQNPTTDMWTVTCDWWEQ